MELSELSNNPLLVSFLSLVAGAAIHASILRMQNKTGILGFYSYVNRVGVSANDNVFGDVRINWDGHEVRNLHSCTVEVENETMTDYEGVELKLYGSPGTLMLNQRTEVVDTPYIVPYTDSFAEEIAVENGQQPTQEQSNLYFSTREYKVPAWNRGQKLRFTYLCTRPNDDLEPSIYISTPSRGVRLIRHKNPYLVVGPILGVPLRISLPRGLLAALLINLGMGLFVKNIWVASSVCLLAGLTAQLIGVLIYRVEKSIRQAVSG